MTARFFTMCALWAAPAVAMAKDAAVAPLVADGVKQDVANNVTNLLAMELDFMGEYLVVNQLEQAPKGLTNGCISSSSCLGRVQRSTGADALIAGSLAPAGSGNVKLTVVLVEGSKVVRRKTFTGKGASSSLADSMGGWMKELVTGVTKEQEAAQDDIGDLSALSTADLFADEDDDDFEIEPILAPASTVDPLFLDSTEEELAAQRQAEDRAAAKAAEEAERAAQARAAEEAAQRAAQARAAEEAAQRAAQARAAEEAAAERAADEARRQAEADAAADSWEDISFASSATAIQVEDIEIPSAASSIKVESTDEDYRYADEGLDDPVAKRSKRERTPKEPKVKERKVREPRVKEPREKRADQPMVAKAKKVRNDEGATDMRVLGRVGYTHFQSLGFLTYGGEGSIAVSPAVSLHLGIEGYTVRREIPASMLLPGEPNQQWNTMFPLNLGGQYWFSGADFRPYLGADFMAIPGYVRAVSGLATGFRGRAGFDYAVSDGLAVNVNVAAGMLSGKDFPNVEDGWVTSALAPSIGAGTVLRF